MNKWAIAMMMGTLLGSAAEAGEYTGNFNGSLGNKSLDDKDWQDVDSQGTIGFIADFKKDSWPVSLSIDAFISAGDDVSSDELDLDFPEVDASTSGIHLGVRKIWNLEQYTFSPYIGGGLAFVSGSQERMVGGETKDESDTATGVWLGAGVYWRPYESLNLGLDIRYSQADVTLFEEDVNAGGFQTGIFVGYSF